MRSKVGPPKAVRESETVVDEKVTRRTEEYVDEVTGEHRVQTVEYVEKLIEREVPYCSYCKDLCTNVEFFVWYTKALIFFI